MLPQPLPLEEPAGRGGEESQSRQSGVHRASLAEQSQPHAAPGGPLTRGEMLRPGCWEARRRWGSGAPVPLAPVSSVPRLLAAEGSCAP